MNNLLSRLQENFLLSLNLESNQVTEFIIDILSKKKYTTELSFFENKIISNFFKQGSCYCCNVLFYNENEMLQKYYFLNNKQNEKLF